MEERKSERFPVRRRRRRRQGRLEGPIHYAKGTRTRTRVHTLPYRKRRKRGRRGRRRNRSLRKLRNGDGDDDEEEVQERPFPLPPRTRIGRKEKKKSVFLSLSLMTFFPFYCTETRSTRKKLKTWWEIMIFVPSFTFFFAAERQTKNNREYASDLLRLITARDTIESCVYSRCTKYLDESSSVFWLRRLLLLFASFLPVK